MKQFTWVAVAIFALSGCGTKVALTRQEFDSVKPPISVARLNTPTLRVPTWMSAILILAGGVITEPAGAYVEGQSTERTKAACTIPDAGYEVLSRFMTIWRKQADAPKMVSIRSPIQADHIFPGASIVFRIEPTNFMLSADGYLAMYVRIIMKDDGGKIIHENNLAFNGYYLDRPKHSHAEFLENNCKLLNEEILLASQYVADGFVKEINTELQ